MADVPTSPEMDTHFIGETLQSLLNIPSTGRMTGLLSLNSGKTASKNEFRVKTDTNPSQFIMKLEQNHYEFGNRTEQHIQDQLMSSPVHVPLEITMTLEPLSNATYPYAPEFPSISNSFETECPSLPKLEPAHPSLDAKEAMGDIEIGISLENKSTPLNSDDLTKLVTAEQSIRQFSIIKLTRKVAKFPKARYWCSCCNYHLDFLSNVMVHIKNERHMKAERITQTNQLLEYVCGISIPHEFGIMSLVIRTVCLVGMSQQDQFARFEVFERLNRAVLETKLNYKLELFGSSKSGFGFLDSDININVNVASGTVFGQDMNDNNQIMRTLLELFNTLGFCRNRNVSEIKESKLLTLAFVDSLSGKVCTIHLNNAPGVICSKLFAEYDKIDIRVRPLVTCFRYWSRRTDIQSPNDGTLQGFSYSVMAIHYLQECGVLPILQDYNSRTINSDQTILQFICAEEAMRSWKTQNCDTLGQLWLGLLKYYSKFASEDKVVSISQPAPSRKSDKAWNRKLSIEDPVQPRTNLARSLSSNKVCDYILDRIKMAYLYFAIPRHRGGPLYHGIIPEEDVQPRSRIYPFNKTVQISGSLQEMIRLMQSSSFQSRSKSPFERISPSSKPIARLVDILDRNGMKKSYVLLEDVELLSDELSQDEYFYEFDDIILQGDEKPPKFCKACLADGHLKKDCPEEALPRMKRVPMDPTPYTLLVLNNVMQRNYELEALNDNDVRIRKKIIDEIYSVLTPALSDIELTMFGSTYNGFGLHMSDIDICLRVGQVNKAEMQTDEVIAILKVVVNQLKVGGFMQEILAIPSAKVPIVKFRHRLSTLEGDISLSNVLALHNTRMLRLYCEIDERLKVLGCFMKRLTKLCDISDASRGSLSSYGYVLMIIHFLQQHNPPVLPVLQELPPGPRPTKVVEGCNAWFFSDIQSLSSVWPQYGKNKQSVSELWTALIKYYAEKFQFDDQVITINQLAPLTRFSKFWFSETVIAIEDPFETSHNLGAGLSRRMGVHIVKTFQRFREVFAIPIDGLGNIDWMLWYLDPRRLRGNTNPPIDRQCRICNRIGHFARNCTFSVSGDDRSYSYKDEEAPTHHTRIIKTVENSNRQNTPRPPYPTRIIQNQKRLSENAINFAVLTERLTDLRKYSSKHSVLSMNNSSTVSKSRRLPALVSIYSEDETKPATHTARYLLQHPSQKSQDKSPRSRSPEMRFFGCSQDSDKVIEAMITKNPGVVFQLQEREVLEEEANVSSTAPEPVPLSTFFGIGPITPPQEYRSTNTYSPISMPVLPPPPGFVKQVNLPHATEGMDRGLGFFDSPVPNISFNFSDVELFRMPPFGSGSVVGAGVGTFGNCAPPPGFSSLPTVAPPGQALLPAHVDIPSNYQFGGTLYHQLSGPITISSPLPQDLIFTTGTIPIPGIPVSVIENHLEDNNSTVSVTNTTNSLDHTFISDQHQSGCPGMMNAMVPSHGFPAYFAHTHGLSQSPLAGLNELNGVSSGTSSPFYTPVIPVITTALDFQATKSLISAMRPGGDLTIQTRNEMLGNAGNSYVLSHVHHGPVVSAVPVQTSQGCQGHQMGSYPGHLLNQTGVHSEMMPMSQPYQYGYGYPFQYPHQIPMQYHHQMVHPGYGQFAQMEDFGPSTDSRAPGPLPIPSYFNHLDNRENYM